MAFILGVDTTGHECACSIFDDIKNHSTTNTYQGSGGHAEALIPLIQSTLDEVDICFSDIKSIVTTLGPGGFTGVRVGLSAAKSFSLSLSIPLYGVSAFQAYVWQYIQRTKLSDQDKIICALDSCRDEFFVQMFDGNGGLAGEPELVDIERFTGLLTENESIGKCHLIGNYTEKIKKQLSSFDLSNINFDLDFMSLDPSVLCAQEPNLKNRKSSDIFPIYLREADTSEAKKKPRILEKQSA